MSTSLITPVTKISTACSLMRCTFIYGVIKKMFMKSVRNQVPSQLAPLYLSLIKHRIATVACLEFSHLFSFKLEHKETINQSKAGGKFYKISSFIYLFLSKNKLLLHLDFSTKFSCRSYVLKFYHSESLLFSFYSLHFFSVFLEIYLLIFLIKNYFQQLIVKI